jgi:bifunctional DNase/RNase
MSDMLEVVIDSVRVSLMSPQRVVILRQKDAERYLPVWVGPYEAESITVALQEVEMARPLTHDLLKNILTLFEGKILRAEIISLNEDVYFGNLVVERGKETLNIDSRPSDAIALAIRAHVPIFVNQAVMDTAGIVPERDMQSESAQPPAEETPSAPAVDGAEEGRLDVFEDFLKKLGGDKDNETKPKK